jgi:hypothetical protein
MVATKIFELSKVRTKNQKNGTMKYGFVVEVHVLDDNSKRFVIVWNGCEIADKKFYKASDLISVETSGNETNRAVAYKSREAKRISENNSYRSQINHAVVHSLSNHEILNVELKTSNSQTAKKLRPGTSIKEPRILDPDINLDAKNYQVCLSLMKHLIAFMPSF